MSWPIGLGRRIAVTASVAVAAATAAMSTLALAGVSRAGTSDIIVIDEVYSPAANPGLLSIEVNAAALDPVSYYGLVPLSTELFGAGLPGLYADRA